MSAFLTPEEFIEHLDRYAQAAITGYVTAKLGKIPHGDELAAHDAEQRRIVALLVKALDESRISHHIERDPLDSCGTERGEGCDCGAEAHNAEIDAAIAAVRGGP
jgi:hypothetical protein